MAEFTRAEVIQSDRLDYSLSEEIVAEPGGEDLFTCMSCGTCASRCLVRRIDPGFNPRLIIHKAVLGLREEALSGPECWECSACDLCYSLCPKEIHISEVMKAIRNVAIRHGYERPGVTAVVDTATCVACGNCVEACPYDAASLQTVRLGRREKIVSQVDRNLCTACGICNAVCPSSSISVEGHTDADLYESLVERAHSLEAVSAADVTGKVLVLACNWCLRSKLDELAASDPPEGVEVIRVPCAGRVSSIVIMTALWRGAESVLVLGCEEAECHFKVGNELAANRSDILEPLVQLLGVDPARIRYERLGALDRGGFARVVTDTVENIHESKALETAG